MNRIAVQRVRVRVLVRARAAGGVQWMKGERQCMQCVEAIEPVSGIRRPMSGRLADRLLVVWCLLTAAHRASASTWQPHTPATAASLRER